MNQPAPALSKLFLGLTFTGLITACGGGGGGGSDNGKPSSAAPLSSSVSSSSAALSTSSSASSQSGEPIISKLIVVDQFGYLPDAQKIAIVRDPQVGYDANESYTPSEVLNLVDLNSGDVVLAAAPSIWKEGATHSTSGDKVWRFDFSTVTAPGTYAVVDSGKNVRSPGFTIAIDVYKPVLKHAFRTFFYQRAGFEKKKPFAEAGWTDAASHLKSGQDLETRLYDMANREIGTEGTEKDLRGGWFDAGDYNKYTNWHADYIIVMLHSYLENPAAWGDDFNIPESGNGVSDLIDEVQWGLEWLKRMQNSDGSVLSIQGLSHASPPSSATGRSFYGPASTSASLSTAAAFALSAKVFGELGMDEYAADLRDRAGKAWTWANENPEVIVHNNKGAWEGLGAGDQEVSEASQALELQRKKTRAAIYLYADTGIDTYHSEITSNYGNRAQWVDQWNENDLIPWLYYASLDEADLTLATNIKNQYAAAMKSSTDPEAISNADGYRVSLGGDGNFTWGSNRSISRKGNSFYNLISYSLGNLNPNTAKNAALAYLNYLHGTNPQGMVYLSNMYSLGVHSSVNEF
jgi:endoglucanase